MRVVNLAKQKHPLLFVSLSLTDGCKAPAEKCEGTEELRAKSISNVMAAKHTPPPAPFKRS